MFTQSDSRFQSVSRDGPVDLLDLPRLLSLCSLIPLPSTIEFAGCFVHGNEYLWYYIKNALDISEAEISS